MKKLFLFTMASLMTVFAMAVGRNDGSTKGNAIDFDWDKGVTHQGDTLWYRIDLDPLYQEDNPSLTLYLTNPSNEVGSSVKVSMEAIIANQLETKEYTIAARQYKTYTANVAMLVRMGEKYIYLTLASNGSVKFSAKVFETADLDETCRDARTLRWNQDAVQNPSYSAWWKVSLKPIKDAENQDAQITITNTGNQTVNLKVGQSLDCPSSGVTRRTYELAPNEKVINTIPRTMITGVQPDEVYFGIENEESQVTIRVDNVPQPARPVIGSNDYTRYDLHVTDTIEQLPIGTTLYRIKVSEMDAQAKYEPEFTYRNAGSGSAKVTVKMAFELPAYGTSDATYELGAGEEEIVVYKKNMLAGMEGVEYVYLLTTVEGDVNFYGRFKHVREGKACKTNIDFSWENGHTQEARTTQWYAVAVDSAKAHKKDIIVHIENLNATQEATATAYLAFSCPYIDLQEISRTITAGSQASHRIVYSVYAMMSDTVWVGLETNQDVKFWADTVDTKLRPEPDPICLQADTFNWDEGALLKADTTVWYVINMAEVREKSAKFPTVFVQNRSASAEAKITAELSLECPDEIENEKRTLTIAANGAYTKRLSSNLFENIVQDEVYVCVRSTQEVSLQIRLSEEAEGTSCSSAVPFNWTSGNGQAANANLWYKVDLREVMNGTDDLLLKIQNTSGATCKGAGKLTFGCPDEETPSVQSFTLAANETKTIFKQHSALQILPDSVVYINLQGSTALHISAERKEAEPFTPIDGSDLTLLPLELTDTVHSTTLESETQWYSVSKEEMKKALALVEKDAKSLCLVLENISESDFDVQIDLAFAFPIKETMIGKKVTVPAGRIITHMLDYKLFKQVLSSKNNILVRVTIPTEAVGKIKHGRRMNEAFGGVSKDQAKPMVVGKRYTQSPNSECWYRINMQDLKKDKDLFNKVINVTAKSAGKKAATVNVKVTDGLASDDDLLYGVLTENSRSIRRGGKSHNIPAQVLYALGEAELYVWISTTDSLVFETKFNGTYAAVDPDPNQQKAKMLVPNVDYVLPADTTMWFLVCSEYIWKNYKYIDATTVEYELEGDEAATIEVTATCQDVMSYKMPVRKVTFNKSKKERRGQYTLRELIDKAIKHYAPKNGLPPIPEGKMDTLLHRFVVGNPEYDVITGYVRVRSNRRIKLRLNTPQITGDRLNNPMDFDWEHGNVNPMGQKTAYVVDLHKGVERLPEDKELRLHVTNWSDQEAKASATIHLDLGTPKEQQHNLNYTLQGNEDTWRNIGRKLLMGDSNPLIWFTSESDVHIWAEIVPARDRDSVVVRDTVWICNGEEVLNPFTGIKRTIELEEGQDSIWKEIRPFINDTAAAEWDSISYLTIKLRQDPNLYRCDQIGEDSIPVIKIGRVIDCEEATAWLMKNIRTEGDSIKQIDTILWEWSLNDANTEFEPIPTTPVSHEGIVLRYRVVTGCKNDTLDLPDEDGIWYFYNTAHGDTVREQSCTKTYIWDLNPLKEYTKPADKNYLTDAITIQTPNGCDSIVPFRLTFLDPREGEETIESCKAIKWHGIECNEQKDYVCDTLHTAEGCDSIATLHFVLLPPVEGTTTSVKKLCSYTWTIIEDGEQKTIGTFTQSKKYDYTSHTAEGCDSIIYLDLEILKAETRQVNVTECNEYKWDLTGITYYKSDDYEFTEKTKDGTCDSIYHKLHLKLNNATIFNLPAVSKLGNHLLMIDRLAITRDYAWDLDSVGAYGQAPEVVWYRADDQEETNKTQVGTGYYLIDNKAPLVGVYWAQITVPGEGACDYQYGYTKKIVCLPPTTSAPALIPSLARPGEDIHIINLDPEQLTYIRVYTTEGVLQSVYSVQGEESYSIKAATEHGFYLVELSGENSQTTLRYIVK